MNKLLFGAVRKAASSVLGLYSAMKNPSLAVDLRWHARWLLTSHEHDPLCRHGSAATQLKDAELQEFPPGNSCVLEPIFEQSFGNPNQASPHPYIKGGTMPNAPPVIFISPQP